RLPQRRYWRQSAFGACRVSAPSGAVAASTRQSRHLLRQTAHARLRKRPRSTKLLQSRCLKQVPEYASCPSPAIFCANAVALGADLRLSFSRMAHRKTSRESARNGRRNTTSQKFSELQLGASF